jgi:hypothetical protein
MVVIFFILLVVMTVLEAGVLSSLLDYRFDAQY